MAELYDSVQVLRGIGKARAEQLQKLGIQTLYDLISYFPREYEDRTRMVPLKALEPGQPACFRAMVTSTPRVSYVRAGLNLTQLTVADDTAQLRVTYFNQPWVADNLVQGRSYYFYGALSGDDRKLSLQNPIYEREDLPPVNTRRIIPIYGLTAGLSGKQLSKLIAQAMAALGPGAIPELLPAAVRQVSDLADCYPAYVEVHNPTDVVHLQAARRRLVFEEFFLYALGLGLMKSRRAQESQYPCPRPLSDSFFQALPFSLTGAQRRTIFEILSDLASGAPMNRLVQGDVGSGKTMVAAAAAAAVIENGYQAALMAPTELLAAQHYATLSVLLQPLGIRCVLLSGSMTPASKRALRETIAAGDADLVIGTHALLSEGTAFCALGLCVVDEQQRFGVRQRAALTEKGGAPHLLVLSATPIPRTLALILYGDLDVSIIDELPPGRQVIDTFLVSSGYRARLLGFLKKQVDAGRQVYVVCPAVEANEETGLKAAETEYEALRQTFPGLHIGLVHGRLRQEEKDGAMTAFARGDTDILVATTVVEVGVDVPNATVMVVEDADRFGLSQLHQLRGRVGRGREKSYCVLVSDNRNGETRRRLKALCETNDGFAISQADLKLRGPGDFFGARQHGLPAFHVASLADDLTVLKEAQTAANAFLTAKPDTDDPALAPLLSRVERLFESAALN